jgi:hypothetical protein
MESTADQTRVVVTMMCLPLWRGVGFHIGDGDARMAAIAFCPLWKDDGVVGWRVNLDGFWFLCDRCRLVVVQTVGYFGW